MDSILWKVVVPLVFWCVIFSINWHPIKPEGKFEISKISISEALDISEAVFLYQMERGCDDVSINNKEFLLMLFDGYPDDDFKERFESKGISVGYQWFYKQSDYNSIIGLEISHFEHIDENHINVIGRIEYRGNQESCKGIYDGNIYYLVNKSRGIWEVISHQKINYATLRVPLECRHYFSLT